MPSREQFLLGGDPAVGLRRQGIGRAVGVGGQEQGGAQSDHGVGLAVGREVEAAGLVFTVVGVLEKQSGGRMKVVNMGPTSEGNPFLEVFITSPANLAKLGEEDRKIAEEQKFCAIETGNRLGAMGKPVMVDDFRFVAGQVRSAVPKMTIPSPSVVHFRG